MFNRKLVDDIMDICGFDLIVFKDSERYSFSRDDLLALTINKASNNVYEYYFTNIITINNDKWDDMDDDYAKEVIDKLEQYMELYSYTVNSLKRLEAKWGLKHI